MAWGKEGRGGRGGREVEKAFNRASTTTPLISYIYNYQLPMPNAQLPVTNYQLPITNSHQLGIQTRI